MKRVAALLTMALVAGGMTVTSAMAIADDGNSGNGSGNGSGGKKHHHHHHRCPAGTHKVITFKHGKRHKKCVKDPVVPAPTPIPGPTAPAAALAIDPTTFDFGNAQHHSGPCSGCPTKSFTVTNTGGQASGTLTVSVTDTADPIIGDDEAFQTISNGCGAALAPGASCTVTMGFSPVSNANSGDYASVLHVTGSPGGDAQAQMSGHAQ